MNLPVKIGHSISPYLRGTVTSNFYPDTKVSKFEALCNRVSDWSYRACFGIDDPYDSDNDIGTWGSTPEAIAQMVNQEVNRLNAEGGSSWSCDKQIGTLDTVDMEKLEYELISLKSSDNSTKDEITPPSIDETSITSMSVILIHGNGADLHSMDGYKKFYLLLLASMQNTASIDKINILSFSARGHGSISTGNARKDLEAGAYYDIQGAISFLLQSSHDGYGRHFLLLHGYSMGAFYAALGGYYFGNVVSAIVLDRSFDNGIEHAISETDWSHTPRALRETLLYDIVTRDVPIKPKSGKSSSASTDDNDELDTVLVSSSNEIVEKEVNKENVRFIEPVREPLTSGYDIKNRMLEDGGQLLKKSFFILGGKDSMMKRPNRVFQDLLLQENLQSHFTILPIKHESKASVLAQKMRQTSKKIDESNDNSPSTLLPIEKLKLFINEQLKK